MAKHAQNGNSHKQSGIALVDAPGRLLTDKQLKRYEGYLAEILPALGTDPNTPGTRTTPRRHLQALIDSTAGHGCDPKLATVFPTEGHGGPDCRLSQVIEGR